MRRTATLAALLLLPLAFLSFRGSNFESVAYNPAVGAEGGAELSTVVGALTPQTGTLAGTVYLVSGPDTMALPRAVVSVSGTGQAALSDAAGQYRFRLPPGVYTVSASVPGYVTARTRAIVAIDETEVVDLYVETVRRPATLHRIEIAVDTITGIVTVSPDPVYIGPGDSVVWSVAGGYPWTVHFSPISPLLDRRILSRGEPRGGSVRADVFPGKYSYFVAVAAGSRVFTADPELIDENGEERDGPDG